MIVRTGQSTIDAYFDSPAVSQSMLKRLSHGVEVFNSEDEKSLYYEEKGHFIIGNGVDVWLTQGANVFEEQFFELGVKKPSDKMKSIIHRLFDNAIEEKPVSVIRNMSMEINVDDRDVLMAAEIEGYQSNYKDATKINSVRTNGSDYFRALAQGYQKQICSEEEWMSIHEIVTSLQENNVTASYFNDETYTGTQTDVFYQYAIYFTEDEVACKALLDMIIINHTYKTIIPIDIKTLGDYTINFEKAIRRRRYDVQAAFYSKAIKSALTALSIATGHDVNQYEILPFRFIVESTTSHGNPLIFDSDHELIKMGTYGRDEIVTGSITRTSNDSIDYVSHSKIMGYVDMLKLYKWHLTNGFDVDKLVHEKEGKLSVGWNKTY